MHIAVFASFIPVKLSCVEQLRREERRSTLKKMMFMVMMLVKKNVGELQAQTLRKVTEEREIPQVFRITKLGIFFFLV